MKNLIIPRIIANSRSDDFTRSGNIAAKKLYDKIKYSVFDNLPQNMAAFKERARRNIFFEVYDLLRNQWVRNGYMQQILTYLQSQAHHTQAQFIQNRLSNGQKRDILRFLRHRYSSKKAGFSVGYLQNMLGELRKNILKTLVLQSEIWETMETIRRDSLEIQEIATQMLRGWKRKRDGKYIELRPEEILPSLFRSYQLSTARYIKRKEISDQVPLQIERELFLSRIHLGSIDLQELITIAINKEMAEWTYDSCVARIIGPRYSKIKPTDLTESGFKEYAIRKLQYHARELFSNDSHVSVLRRLFRNKTPHDKTSILATILESLNNELATTITPPCVKSLTWSIKFTEQLYSLEVGTNPQGIEESVAIILKPYSRHQGFKFQIHSKTIDRLRKVVGDNTPISDLLSVVPIVQLQGRKIIFNQPLNMATQDKLVERTESRDFSSVRVMGVDLGLKHFAVLSIFEHNVATGQKQEIGRHFIDQRRLLGCPFDTNNLRFGAPNRPDYNIKRGLERLRKQQRALSSIVGQMEDDGGAKRTKEFFYAKKRFKFVWDKIKRVHDSLTQHIAHLIILIAHAYDVDKITFEDLRWSQHSSRREVGGWLSHNQQHFFHSQIIQRVKDMAIRHRFEVKCVNARWSSKISWTAQLEHNLAITHHTTRSEVEQYIGGRNGKIFRYSSSSPTPSWQGDSDLNAARNIALRGLLLV